MGTTYFIGFMISSILVPRVSDSGYGRKGPYAASVVVSLISYIAIYLSTSIYITIFVFLCLGLCAGGRVCVGLVYMNEFVPLRYHNLTTTIYNLGDSCILLFQAPIYAYVPDWMAVHSVVFFIIVCQLIALLLIPESPKFMYANRRFDMARQLLKVVARKNKAKVSNEEIDNIMFEFEFMGSEVVEE
jgi:MFS family permease